MVLANEDPKTLGLAKKGAKGRLAIRFAAHDEMLQAWTKRLMHEAQAGFRQGRGVDDVLQVTRRILEEVASMADSDDTILISAQLLQKKLPAGSFSEIVPRTAERSLSATFSAHSDVVDTILRMSGTDAVFYKLHDSEHIWPDLELLWLPEDTSLDYALQYTKETGVFGIALKNAAIQPRLALRFMSQDARLMVVKGGPQGNLAKSARHFMKAQIIKCRFIRVCLAYTRQTKDFEKGAHRVHPYSTCARLRLPYTQSTAG